jgi:hypothetical protein
VVCRNLYHMKKVPKLFEQEMRRRRRRKEKEKEKKGCEEREREERGRKGRERRILPSRAVSVINWPQVMLSNTAGVLHSVSGNGAELDVGFKVNVKPDGPQAYNCIPALVLITKSGFASPVQSTT